MPGSRSKPRSDAGLPPGEGVVFPGGSTTPTGRGILADAARAADADLATRIEQAGAWRRDYAPLLRDVTAVSARSPETATAVADAGLRSMRSRMRVDRDGRELALGEALATAKP